MTTEPEEIEGQLTIYEALKEGGDSHGTDTHHQT